MDVIVKGSPSIEIGFERKVVDSYKAVDTALSESSVNPVQNKVITEELNKKANTDGKYPDLIAGDLVGRGESVPAEFSFRASGGKSIKDGTAWIKRLKGNSVVWNQKLQWRGNGSIYRGITATYEGGKVHMQGIAENTTIYFYSLFFDDIEAVPRFQKNHYYLIRGASEHFELAVYSDVSVVGSNCITQKTGDVMRVYVRGSDLTIGQEVDESFSAQVIDLTQMFGAGNEPTTIEEFYARKPIVEDEYAYNEGEVIHMTAEGIKSVGDNAWDEEWESGIISYNTGIDTSSANHCRTVGYTQVIPNEQYYISFPAATATSSLVVICYDANKAFIQHIGGGSANKTFTIPANCHYIRFTWIGTEYANNIMLTLVHSGWKQDTDAGYQPYWEDRLIFDQRIKDEFPDGMKKWDMVYNKDGKGYIVKGTGVVDMGDMAWYMSNGRFVCDFPNAPAVTDGLIRELCAKYVCVSPSEVYNNLDKAMFVGASGWFNPDVSLVIVNDTSYTDAASFKAAMAGVMLYYELAEPTIIEYDEPFNLDYRVADFGTEQAIAEQPSAPISADIIYQFNAVDMIREHELEINELQAIIATMQAQLASLTSNNG